MKSELKILISSPIFLQIMSTLLLFLAIVRFDYVICSLADLSGEQWLLYQFAMFDPKSFGLTFIAFFALTLASKSIIPLFLGLALVYTGPLDLLYFVMHGRPIPETYPHMSDTRHHGYPLVKAVLTFFGKEVVTRDLLFQTSVIGLTVVFLSVYLSKKLNLIVIR